MMVLVGSLIVIVSVIGAYVVHGGHLGVLWQPSEFVIIMGSALGAYIIGNPKTVLSQTLPGLKVAISGGIYKKEDFLELLTMQFAVYKMMKSKGILELESHIENPEESALFQRFPKFLHDHHALTFFCDYMRMMTMGGENPHQMEDLMNMEIDVHHQDRHALTSALQTMADSCPALGIVAAVLGVIHTMGSISQPPEVLGHLIGAALVGTFLGILLSYGFVGPLANVLKGLYEVEGKYYLCMKAGILAYMNGYAPAVAVEFARKAIEPDFRPDFYELETAISEMQS